MSTRSCGAWQTALDEEDRAESHLPEEKVERPTSVIYKKLVVRYWTEVNPKSILKEFWYRIRKAK